ncbi:uncharacterized protein M421DRAFT_154349 [Didymella exigua CBS 183.55]|uniref:Uncharacterized protein n=1 Tax=Didymella exigua CBS 183.55 TaxID=1150837 RepID=A0A6A5RNZ7_9PLEO|nr:uncharacterized protein M421DRAFT_154349 [Didymella exigua CBS 183.55]KAF1928754.1 hypothetical protein M421DRAFT_154349 [Didymella exigua CBS 183.55]
MCHLPPLSPPKKSLGLASSSVDNMNPLRPLQPNVPSIAAWPPPRAPTVRTSQQQRKQQQEQRKQQGKHEVPVNLRDNVLPFDCSASVLPGLTFPEDFRAYHCPRDETILTQNYQHSPPNPLRKASHDPVFFSSLALRSSVAELFGCVVTPRKNDQHVGGSIWQAPPALPYDPEDDDVVAWKKGLEGGTDDEHNRVKACAVTWPLWNSRLDLEM